MKVNKNKTATPHPISNLNTREYKSVDEVKSAWRTFVLGLSLIVVFFVLVFYIGVFVRNDHLIHKEMLTRSRAYMKQLVLTRRWNSEYGGVFVEKKPGVHSNPYLKDPDIISVDGKVYTKKNPALMAREISELAQSEGLFQFRITSLTPLNPDNFPDPFESEALRSFEEGIEETSKKEIKDGSTYFRYMVPLYVEESCLECHRHQGV